ncbi:type IV secretory system conjugative DNA transfer family protein [Yersinia enterocolitica]|uniref:TriK family protein n=1 Tax=Obesumbacterium proteus ATCC 12841 TaxID=1354268 RepID=A0AA91IMF3_9GAMM|nr:MULTISPECIES: TraM recognition domain-containing protein [Enterobacterales]EBU9557439.1 MFS transporter [Salmonella enterica subsp. enterica serovar Goldcoast]EKN6067256.1 MFS transporter [Yersinia enterocolitica]EBY1295636.1 MFS transporter [Salmonella enterica subsp. enterica serovar Goldcoast]EDY0579544.1 TraM recognition domain-containing protein [Salmonella enterica subsp. enterica serovar Goldcoast]MDA5499672.1 TraM recognition domain-containing protein [Yersinia aleksiciae]
MLNKITEKLMPIVDNATAFFGYMQQHQLLLALLSGLTLPFIVPLKRDEHEKAPIWQRVIICFSFLCFIFGTISPATSYVLRFLYPSRLEVSTPVILWAILISFTVVGVIFHYVARRILSPEIDKLKRKMVKKTSLERNTRTDVREIKALLPTTEKYDPEQFIDLKKGVFIGLNENRDPQYIPLSDWQKQHADVIGTTGAGKGVATGLLIYQSILADEGVFEMDPKNDEWAPHLIRKACEDAGKPFYLIDLNKPEYQLNLIDGITAEHLEELFIAGFSLAEKGEAADFYRIDDRRAARATAQLINENPTATIRDLFNSDFVQSIAETIKGFFGKIEELALLNSINAPDGLALKKIFDDGGCCYIIGSMRNSKVIATQRMILVRLMQLAELRDRINTTPRPIAIHLAELKYHLSRPALEGLGAARDKGVHIIMDHQSVADLRDCPADLNGDAVVGAVVENAKFKLVYKLQDPDTALWVAKMSGTILVDDESRKAKTNRVLTEVIDDERTIRQAERFYIDSNMLLNLPPFVSYIFTATELPRASLISPLKVKKQPLQVYDVTPITPISIKKPLDFTDAPAAQTTPVLVEAEKNKPAEIVPLEPVAETSSFDFDE